MSGLRLPSGGGVDRGRAARLHLRRQALRRLRGRQHRVRAARQRRRHCRPQLQISPPARNLGRMDGGAERDRRRDAGRRDHAQSSRHHRDARERPRRALGQCGADRGGRSRRAPRQARAVPAGGVLLQDVSLAAVGDLRGRDPRHGRPRPRRSGQSPARRQSADQRALRSPHRRRRGGGARRGKRRRALGAHGFPRRRPSRDRRPARPPRRDDRRRRLARMGGERRQGGRSRRRPRDDANDRLWRLRRQSRLRLGAAGAAARRALAHPAEANRDRGRRDRAAARRRPTTTGRA